MIKIFTPEDGGPEEEARRQLERIDSLDYVQRVVGLPDLHPGKGGPVGAAILADYPIPVLVGNDVGCGFSVSKLGLKTKRLRDPEWLADRLDGLDMQSEDTIEAFRKESDGWGAAALGTIGGGNHFAEVSMVFRADPESGLEEGDAVLLVHSGSRASGEVLWQATAAQFKDGPIQDATDIAEWMASHDRLLEFAARNRSAVASRVADAFGVDVSLVSDVVHNFVERTNNGFIHRKGSSTATQGLVLMAGTRSTPSYLLMPSAGDDSLYSLPHGAGRKLPRSAARSTRFSPETFRKGDALSPNGIRSLVICGDPDLLLEERAGAYQDITKVAAGTVSAGLATIVAEFHPVVTFKTSDATASSRDKTRSPERKARDIERKKWR